MPGSDIIGPFPPGCDPVVYDQVRRRILWSMPVGLYLLGTRSGEDRNLMTTSLVMQVAMSPKLVGASVETSAHSLELIRAGGCFSVCLLSDAQRNVVRKFVKPAVAGPEPSQLSGFAYFDAPVSGAPVPEVSLCYLDCRLEREIELGSHSLVIGEVLDAAFVGEILDGEHVLEMSDTRMSYGG